MKYLASFLLFYILVTAAVTYLIITLIISLLTTGIGAWQTVSIRQVMDEEKELQDSEQMREEMLRVAGSSREANITRNSSSSAAASRGGGEAEEEGEDNAMSAYDPYGRHKQVYKGIRLYEDEGQKEKVESFMTISYFHKYCL